MLSSLTGEEGSLGNDIERLPKSQKICSYQRSGGFSTPGKTSAPHWSGRWGSPPQLDLLKEAGQGPLPRMLRVTEEQLSRRADQVFLGRIGRMQSRECLGTGGKS